MSHETGRSKEKYDIYKLQRAWFRKHVVYIERYLEYRQSKKAKETPQDRASRRTANATYWIAAFTLVTAAVGIKTYLAIDGQLRVMQGQLNEMHSGGVDTAKFAEAAVKQANAAKSQADSLVIVATNAQASAEAARKSAEAAAKTIDTSQRLNRPRFVVSSAVVTPEGDAVKYTIDNIGATAGIIRTLFMECIRAEGLPLIPIVHNSKAKVVQFLITPNSQPLSSSDISLNCPIENIVDPHTFPQTNSPKVIIFRIIAGYDGYIGRSYTFSTAGIIDPAKGMTRIIGGKAYNNEDEAPGLFDASPPPSRIQIEP